MENKARIIIRKATFGDAPEIFSLGERSFKAYGTEDWTFSLVAELLEEFPDYSLVSIDEKNDNKIAGFLLSKPHERSQTKFYIYWVAVHPSYRGMGIGTGMVVRINEIAASAGFQAMVADTGVNNKGMQGVFKRTGFKVLTENVYFIKRFTQTEKRTIEEQTGIGVNARVPLSEKLEQVQKPSSEADNAKAKGQEKVKERGKAKAKPKPKTKAKVKAKRQDGITPKDASKVKGVAKGKDKERKKATREAKQKVKPPQGSKTGRKGK